MANPVAKRYLRQLAAPTHDHLSIRERAILVRDGDLKLTAAQVDEAIETTKTCLQKVERARVKHVPKYDQKRDAVLRDGQHALEKLRSDGPNADLTSSDILGLEAIKLATGVRPSIAVKQGKIDRADLRLGQWRAAVERWADAIAAVSRSVGRIDLADAHIGTGFSVAPGLLVTNRHVLQAIAEEVASGTWRFFNNITVNFDGELDSSSTGKKFNIVPEVVMTPSKAIDINKVDFAKIDLAILRYEVHGDDTFAPRLPVEELEANVVTGRPIYVMGFPGKPLPGAESFKLLMEIFDFKFSVKRFSPGEIEARLPLDDDINQTVFSHDCTTLGGSSGSAVIDFGEDGTRVIGLHFGGSPRVANYGHSLASLRHLLDEYGIDFVR